jgi:hypothetical protein
MGSSTSKAVPCPFDELVKARRMKATTMRFVRGAATDFYFACSEGRIDIVQQTLDAEDAPSIDELNRLQANGSTALHAATYNNHLDIVRLLLDNECDRTTLNRFGKTAYDEASTPEMKQLFQRCSPVDRFHEINALAAFTVYLPNEDIEHCQVHDRASYVHLFTTHEEVLEYTLNQQTSAMWLKFCNWAMHTFRTYIEREDLHVDTFDLQNHPDFRQFVNQSLTEFGKVKTMESIHVARQNHSIEPLITLYTCERAGFYGPVNLTLVRSPSNSGVSPHSCDRFLFEFHLHRDELTKRAFTGIVYRGATMSTADLNLYRCAHSSRPVGVVGLKTFTSTSRDCLVALNFAFNTAPAVDQENVIFVFDISQATPMIFAVDDVSVFGHEKEVLMLPGNLFTVTRIEKQDHPSVTKVYLKHWNVPVSFWKKIRQTFRAGRKSVL